MTAKLWKTISTELMARLNLLSTFAYAMHKGVFDYAVGNFRMGDSMTIFSFEMAIA